MKWFALRRKNGEIIQVATNTAWLKEMQRVMVNYDGCEIVEVEVNIFEANAASDGGEKEEGDA